MTLQSSVPLTEEQVLEIHRKVFADGMVTPAGIDLLFETLAAHGDAGPVSWPDLFKEALAAYLVEQTPPAGYISQENADWLVARVSADRRVFRKTEFDGIVHVMERARSVPDSLPAFALSLLAEAIVAGDGVLVDGAPREPGLITAEDVEALRLTLYAATSEGFGHVTKAEAEALFALVRATPGRRHHPAFDDLFARAVGNQLLAHAGRRAPEAAEALRRERWLNEHQSLLGGLRGVFSRALTCVISGDGFVGSGGWVAQGAADSLLPGEDGLIDEAEASWLRGQMGSCDPNSGAIQALRAFVETEGGIDLAQVEALFDKVA